MKKLSHFACGELVVEYYQQESNVEWIIIPKERAQEVKLPEKQKYDSLIQAKLVGDDYPKGFCTGSTMRNSQTVKNLQFKEQLVKEKEEELEIQTYLIDRQNNLYCHFAVCQKKMSVIETYVTFTNHSGKEQVLEMLSSFSLSNLSPFHHKNPAGNLSLTRYQSKWSFEGRKVTQYIEELQLEPSWKPSGVGLEKFGQVGSMPVRGWFPHVSLTDHKKNVSWSATIAHPGSWQIEAYRLDEDLCLSGGLADRDYGHWLKKVEPGETYMTPKAYITCLTGDEEESAQQLLHFLEKPLFERKNNKEEQLSVQFNEFCTTWGKPTEKSVIETLPILKNRGIDYYIIDTGWYADPQQGWERSHGDWIVNKKQFPNGLSPVVQEIKATGMIPGIWFEIETVGEDSIASTFIDHLLSRDGVPLTVGNRRFWNMCDPWVKDYLKERVIDFLIKYDIGYLKIDYNENFGIGFDVKESFGEANRQQLEASQAFIREIQNALPDLIIENCSSGGHRLEPSMMGMTDLSSFSDAHEATCIPIIAGNLHQLVLPRQSLIWAVLRKEDTKQRLYYSMSNTFLGRMCLSGDIQELNKQQWKIIDDGISFYERLKPLIKTGKTKKIGNEILSYREPKGYQAIWRFNEKQGMLVIHNFDESAIELPIPQGKIIQTFGIDEQNIIIQWVDNQYHIHFPDCMMGCAILIAL